MSGSTSDCRTTSDVAELLPYLTEQERAELDLLLTARADEPHRRHLADFIPWKTPGYMRPDPLRPITDCYDRINAGERVEVVVHCPPQHGKTDSHLHGIAWLLWNHPEWPVQYITHTQEKANEKSSEIRRIATELGVTFRQDTNRLNLWRTAQGSGVLAAGIGKGAGSPAQVLVIDDPYPGREEAESAAYRRRVESYVTGVGLARLREGGSILINSTRWHKRDISGTFIDHGFPYYRLPAIQNRPLTDYDPRPYPVACMLDEAHTPIGAALWPELKSLGWLLEQQSRVGAYDWASVWQGDPLEKGGRVFGPPAYYDELPTAGYRTAIGFDLAYTAKTHADYSAALAMIRYAERYFIVDVVRKQEEAPAFATRLRSVQTRWGCPAYIYASGTEKGSVQLFRREPYRVNAHILAAKGDKFQRAQGVAAAWNEGRVMVPRSAPWLEELLDEIEAFTGIDDDHDDQVDALAAAYDVLAVFGRQKASTRPW